MNVSQARAIAAEWVAEHGASMPGFAGAFHHGSSNWLDGDTELPSSSDVDVMVVLEGPEPATKPGKFAYRGALIEVSLVAAERLASADVVLADHAFAHSFARPNIIADPSGALVALQAEVATGYAQSRWVRARCESVIANVRRFAASLDEAQPFYDQATSWLFATGGLAHVFLVAGLANPTVRRRYAAARALLATLDLLDAYEPLLEALGCTGMTADRVTHHVDALALAFDAASAAITSPFFFASDLSQLSRPIAIDGSRELIAQGLHREAVFWIGATYGRCLKVLHTDAPPGAASSHDAAFAELLADLGVATYAHRRQRLVALEASLGRAPEVAAAIIAATPAIRD